MFAGCSTHSEAVSSKSVRLRSQMPVLLACEVAVPLLKPIALKP
ncbi:MAG: hypothetical protein ACFB4J_09875 [Elainellaceae cyanobacterium]